MMALPRLLLITIVLSATAVDSIAVQLDCAGLIKGDHQEPAFGAYAYASQGSGGDQRCEGRIIELHAGSSGFVIDSFVIESAPTRERMSGTIQIGTSVVAPGAQRQVTLSASGVGNFYRLDAVLAGDRPIAWAVDMVAGKLNLDWPKARVIGRIAGASPPVVFFPISLRGSGEASVREPKLSLRAHYTDRSAKVSAFVGSYGPQASCAVSAEAPLQQWTYVSPSTPLVMTVPPSAASKFCIVFEYDVLGADGIGRQDRAQYFFLK